MPLIYPKQGVFKWAATGATTAMNGAKQTLGWVAELPTMQNMNWLFQQFSIWLQHINSRGISDWDNAIIYEPGALAMHSDNEVYRCILTTTAGIAPSNASYWTKYSTHISPDASTTVKGIAQVATTAEAQAWVSDADMMTPLKLAQAFQTANQTLAASGYQKFPGGLILMWFTQQETGTSINFPTFAGVNGVIPGFPTGCLAIMATHNAGGTATAIACNAGIVSASQFTLIMGANGGTDSAKILAIGY